MFNKVLGLKKIYFIHFHIGFNVKLQHIKRLQIKLSILGAGPFISRIKSYRLYVGILRTEQITKQFIKIRLRNKRATYKSCWHTMASHVVFVVDFQSKQKKLCRGPPIEHIHQIVVQLPRSFGWRFLKCKGLRKWWQCPTVSYWNATHDYQVIYL